VLVKRRIQTGIQIAIAAVMVATSLVGSKAFAETVNDTTSTLKVTPVRRDVEIKPGESKTVKMTVTNLTTEAIAVRPIENDFVAGDERGTPALILDEDKYAPTHSLKRFMSPLPEVTIPAKQAKTIDVVITVPKSAQPGGYFGAVRFAPSSSTNGGQVNLNASVASLVLMTVPGKAVEKLALTDFNVQQKGVTGEMFGSPDNLQVTARFENKGGLQEGPFGKVSVRQDDKKVVYETDFNNKDPRDMVLPDSARRWDIPLKSIGAFGHYTVTATFTYGKSNQTIDVTKSFWVIPQMVIIAAIVGTLVLIGLIVGIWMFLRNYKRRILHKHGGSGGGLSTHR
jgi:hypothetical protein